MSDDFEMEVVESPSLEDGSSDEGTGQPSPSGDSSSSFLVGALPDEWDAHRLDDICQVNPESFSQDSHEADEFEYISLSDATDGVVTNTESVPVEEAPSRATRKVREGDVLVGTVRPKQSSHGFATEEHDGKVCSSGFGVLRTDGHVNSQYLRQEVLSHRFFRQMMAYVAGSGYPAVKLSDLEKHRIALPSLPEQRKIASVLYAVDQAIQKTEAIIEQAKRVKRGLIRSLLKKGIRPDGKIRDLDCEPESFQKTRLGTIPERWSIAQFKEAATLRHGFQFRSYHFSEAGYPVVKIKNVTDDGTLDMSDASRIPKSEADQFEDVELFEGDLLMSLTGNIGRVVEVPKTNVRLFQNYRVGRFTSQDQKKLSSGFLKLVLSSDLFYKQLMRQSSKTAQSNIGKKDFQRTLLPIPPLEEQNRISEKVEAHLEYIQQEKSNVDRLRRLKKGLMQDLLTGEVRTMDKAIEVLGEVKAHG
jgi:type I restriction enzyme S subunit